ncbi:MAG TPA: hypothetical protein EYP22_07845, partial [Methanosarcinales archaeon]|nr:hypothetical protein [Methanosarcinales archaeon]
MKKNTFEDYQEVIPEEVDRREFTDREDIINRLYKWALGIEDLRSKSLLFVSPRRYGKTAILTRLYNKLFWEQDKVAPFFFKVKAQKYTMKDFAIEYALTFYKQYIGFQLKDPSVITEDLSIDDLVKIAKEKDLEYVAKRILAFKKISSNESWIRIWSVAQSAPNKICFDANKRVAVILDEFQCLDELVYIDEAKTLLDNSITPSYHSVCTDIRAPMLVSGSLVTIVTRKVMSGPLRGRFGKIKLGLLDFDDALALVFKLSEKYNLPVTFETAKLIVEISGRNPFYINSAFASSMQNKDLSTIKGVEEVYKFEVTNEEGMIYEFWDKHFKRNLRLLNKDPPDNFGLTKQIIFYILKYQDKKVSYEDIARKFGIGVPYALEKLEDLMEMDLVEESSYGFVYG